MIEWLYNGFQYILEHSSPYLEQHISWYLIVMLYAVVYIFFFELLRGFIKRELRKRKEILIDVSLYKEFQKIKDEKQSTETDKEVTEENEEEKNVTKMVLQYKQKTYSETYYRTIKSLIRDRNPKPFMMIIAITTQSILTYSIFSYLLKQNALDYQIEFATLASLLSVFLLMGKKKLWIRIPMCICASCFYFFIGTSEALIFISLVSVFKVIKKMTKR